MRFNFFLIILLTTKLSLSFAGIDCNLIKKLESPKLEKNEQFWVEYSLLSSKNQLNDKNLSELLKKHDVDSPTKSAMAPPDVAPVRLSTSKRALKEIAALPNKAVKKNFDEFMEIMKDQNGMKELYKNPGRWHLEKIKAFPEGNVFSARLNGGHRVLFKYEQKELTVMEVNASHIHGY